MSIFHLTNDHDDPTNRQKIYIQSCDCTEGMKISETLEVRDLFFDAVNGDKIELSSVLNKGTFGSVLKSNGDGTVQWGTDLTGGVNYTGSKPTVVNQLSLYNSTDGTTIKNSSLVEQDLLDTQTKANNNETDISNLQTDKLNRDGTIAMTGNLNMNNNVITNCDEIKLNSLSVNDDPNGKITCNTSLFTQKVEDAEIEHTLLKDVDTSKVEYRITPLLAEGLPNRYEIVLGLDDRTQLYLNDNEDDPTRNENFAVLTSTGKSGLGDYYNVWNGTKIEIDDPSQSITLNSQNITLNSQTITLNNNNITNCNNIQTQSIKATDDVSVNFDNNIELQGNAIKSTKEVDFFFNSDSANIGVGSGNLEIRAVNCGLNMYSGMNKYAGIGINDGNNNITLNYLTNTVDLNSLDINLNGNNIIGLELINGIQPSGGLYSESSGFTILAVNTIETNLLGQGASSGSLLIPANTFTALSFYSFKASGILSGGANDTFTLRALSLTGIPSVVDLGVIEVQITDNGLVDKAWNIVIDFTIRQIGGLGVAFLVLSGYFQYTNNNDVVKTYLRSFKNNTTFSTETSNELVLEYKNDITNPLTSFTIEQASFTKWY